MESPIIPAGDGAFAIPSDRPVTGSELAALVGPDKRLVFKQACHQRVSLAASYINGTIEIVCAVCGKPVISIPIGG